MLQARSRKARPRRPRGFVPYAVTGDLGAEVSSRLFIGAGYSDLVEAEPVRTPLLHLAPDAFEPYHGNAHHQPVTWFGKSL